ncbi:MAG TPA: T9SS type A sorting domain-containing protein [Bacteroidia bacterium]|jgi:hypothetical protein|nr:T9SS type A sorting domain-containing protein [Bacteroidia bacterium]
MKKLLLSFVILTTAISLKAQLNAGTAPGGMFITNPFVSASLTACSTSDSIAFDLNCDNVNDMSLWLYKGVTMIDGANMGLLYILNDSIEICKDTNGYYSSFSGRPHYFNNGDPIVQTNTDMWAHDSIYELGDYGCMGCTGPYSETNMYIGYRKGSNLSWMKISFSLSDGGSCTMAVTATISQILTPCNTSGVQQLSDGSSFSIYPNPFNGETTLRTDQPLDNATLIIENCFGQTVSRMENISGQSVSIPENDLPGGIYFLLIEQDHHVLATSKLMVTDH